MTSVIGDQDNGWTSATMHQGSLIEQHREKVQDIHQESTAKRLTPAPKSVTEQYAESMLGHDVIMCGCMSAGKISVTCEKHQAASAVQESVAESFTPEVVKKLLDEGAALADKLKPRIDRMKGSGMPLGCGPGLCGTYSECRDCGRSPYPKVAPSTSRLFEEERSMLKELNKPYPVHQILNHVESHIILDTLKKQPLTLSQLIGCDQLSNVSAKAVITAVNYLISSGRITLGADSILQVIAESQPVQSATAASPKTLDSSHKIPVNLCPASAIIAIALVIAQGHKKPGRTIYNWRDKNQKISYMDYHAAALRHLLKSIDGSDFDQELSELAGVPVRHDWAAMSCLAILEDARQAGTLVDDRPTKGGAEEFLDKLTVKK